MLENFIELARCIFWTRRRGFVPLIFTCKKEIFFGFYKGVCRSNKTIPAIPLSLQKTTIVSLAGNVSSSMTEDALQGESLRLCNVRHEKQKQKIFGIRILKWEEKEGRDKHKISLRHWKTCLSILIPYEKKDLFILIKIA